MKKISLKSVSLAIILGIVFMLSTALAETLPKFTIMTERWVPYQFEENEKIQGVAVDFLILMLARVGSSQNRNDIKMYPWARGYKYAQNKENTILFSTTRTEERKKMFKWVGPIFQNTTGLIAKKDKNIIINSPKDLKKYKIGTTREDVGEQYMVKLGISLDQLQRSNSYISNLKKLNRDRIDFVVSGFPGFSNDAKSIGINPDLFEIVFIVKTADISYAFYKGTPDWIINKFQKALDELKAEGKFDELMDKYKDYTK